MEQWPKVSVVVPVYNCRSSLRRAFTSVFEQTMPAADIEIIAVDDGSTDGSGEELERLAASRPGFTVLRQRNSGGPGAPRNRGIERASGEYIFFLDADDYFAPEALEHMCGLADANGTDVVVGQCVGVNRKPPVFPHDLARTSLEESPFIYDTLSPLKLFRRALLEKHELRFLEGLPSHEDQLFTARAYFEADGISVLASYDCYYWVDREDGTSSMQSGGAPAERYFPVIADVMAFTAARAGVGPLRDRLLQRHFRLEVLGRFGRRYTGLPDEEKAVTKAWARELLDSWYTSGIEAGLGTRHRLLAHCLRHGLDDVFDEVRSAGIDGDRPPAVVDGDRVYKAFPGFRDASAGIPDSCYDITDRIGARTRLTGLGWEATGLRIDGSAVLTGIPGEDQTVTVVLRNADGDEHRIAAHRPDGAAVGAFSAEIGFDPGVAPAPGTWKVYVEAGVQRLRRVRRLTAGGVGDIDVPAPRLGPSGHTVRPRLSGRRRALNLQITGTTIGRSLVTDDVVWSGPGRLRVSAHVAGVIPPGHPVGATAWIALRGTGDVRPAEAGCRVLPGRLDLSAEFDLAGCEAGRWDPWLELAVDGTVLRGRPRWPDDGVSAESRGGPVVPYRTERGALSVRVTADPKGHRIRRMARRLRRR